MRLALLFMLAWAFHACSDAGVSQGLTGQVSHANSSQIYLYSTIGHTFVRIDSSEIDKNGRFGFDLDSLTTGFFKLALNDSDLVDIIINPNEKKIKLRFDSIPLQNYIHVEESAENKMLWEFKAISKQARATDVLLMKEKYALPSSDSLGRVNVQFKRNQNEQWKSQRLREITATNPESYFTKITSIGEDLEYVSLAGPLAMLNTFDFADSEFLQSTTYAKALLHYLRAVPLDNEQDFMRNIDNLIDKTKANERCREYTVNYFIELFQLNGPELAYQHIVSNHLTETDILQYDSKTQQRMRSIRNLGLGMVAPSLSLQDLKGNSVEIATVAKSNKATCLFFYSSNCDHCHDQMPGLKVLYEGLKEHGFDVMGIALDLDTVEFQRCISEQNITWPSYTELQGWESHAAKAFEIAATPSFYLLDNKMRIMAKPSSSEALMSMLQRLPEFKDLGE